MEWGDKEFAEDCDRQIADLRKLIWQTHKQIELWMQIRKSYEGCQNGNNTLD